MDQRRDDKFCNYTARASTPVSGNIMSEWHHTGTHSIEFSLVINDII